MMNYRAVFCVSAFFMGFSSIAGAAEPVAPASAEQAAAPEKKICKEQGVTGTRISKKRSCKTAAEWDALKNADRKNIDAMFDTKGVGSVAGKRE